MLHRVGDAPENLPLILYTDADHASDVEYVHSRSGMLFGLEGDRTFWPLAWGSRKQTAMLRSATAAEIISVSTGVFTEASPAQ